MNILVTGGAGYIGAITCRQLIEQGHDVAVFDQSHLRPNLNFIKQFVCGDVRDTDLLRQTVQKYKINTVIHFAAKINVAESMLKPLEYYSNNVGGLLSVLQICTEFKITKFIFSSTATVYKGQSLDPLKETDALAPISPYGWSKQMGETILLDFKSSWPQFQPLILRYFNVAGATLDNQLGQPDQMAPHLIATACRSVAQGSLKLKVFGTDYPTPDGTCIRDYIHVEDLASAHVDAVKAVNLNHPGGIFNCGYGKGASVTEVIEAVQKVAAKNLSLQYCDRREGDPAILIADNNKLRQEFGWFPQHDSLEVICKTALAWEQKRILELGLRV